MYMNTINPVTGEILDQYVQHNSEQINEIIEKGHQAYLNWRNTSFSSRRSLMLELAKRLRGHQDEFAKLMALEMGKPISLGKAEIEKCAWVCEHYAENAEGYLAPREIKTEKGKHIVCYQPLGIVFAIMPWNFPFWQVFRFAAPNIMAGNGAILKHAPTSTGTGLAIEKIFLEAGLICVEYQDHSKEWGKVRS